MTRTFVSASALALLLSLAFAGDASALPEATRLPAVAPLIFPAPQTSVTSTQFNPNVQNPGGTTNSAGTFNVQSLARSSSYAYDDNLPKTTSFEAGQASIAEAGDRETPDYFSNTASSTVAPIANQQSSATASSVSLVASSAGESVGAATTVPNNGAGGSVYGLGSSTGGLGMALAVGAAAVLGAAVVL